MKPLRFLILSVIALAATALNASPIKLKLREALNLRGAYTALDGFQKPLGAGENAQTIRQPYDFKTRVRIDIAKNLAALNVVQTSWDATLQRITTDIVGPAGKTDDPAKIALYNAAVSKELDSVVGVELQAISQEDLNLDVNKEIPGTVLGVLLPYLAQGK